MPLIMRFTDHFIFLIFLSCASGSQKTNNPADSTKPIAEIDPRRAPGGEENQVDFRQEFISLYQRPVHVDTSFLIDRKKYRVVFRHFSSMDNGLLVPAKYNFDTHKDFITHNFASDLTVLSNNDTAFKKHITKSTFENVLDNSLKNYGTLLYPDFHIKGDSIRISYSISIPVTDIGI